jgi:hypothetical protein
MVRLMSITWHINRREGIILASGLAAGAVLSAAIVLAPRWRAPAVQPTGTATAQRVAMGASPRAACPQQPAAAPSGAADGRFHVPARLSSYGPSDIGAFMTIGKEAAAAGRPHDAEVAFIMACRVADQFKGSDSTESGRARDQLAVHYDDLLREAGPAVVASRGELQHRVALLRPGRAVPPPERPVLMAQVPAPPSVPAPAPAPAAIVKTPAPTAVSKPALAQPAPPPKPVRRVELAQARPTPKLATAQAVHPSFDCGKARSASEKLICSDARLAQLDRELAQLHARARMSARNTWAFQQRNDEEWRRREATCRDRDCLLRWYGQRRYQLMNEIESG